MSSNHWCACLNPLPARPLAAGTKLTSLKPRQKNLHALRPAVLLRRIKDKLSALLGLCEVDILQQP